MHLPPLLTPPPTSWAPKRGARNFVPTPKRPCTQREPGKLLADVQPWNWEQLVSWACWGQRGRGEAPCAVNLPLMSTYYVPGATRLQDHKMKKQGPFPSETISGVQTQLRLKKGTFVCVCLCVHVHTYKCLEYKNITKYIL